MLAGVEQQADGLDRPSAVEELGRQLAGDLGIHRRRAERGRGGEVEPARDLAAQRDAGDGRPIDEPGAGEAVEEVAVDAGRPGQQADDRALLGGELLQRRRAGRPHHP